MNTRLFTQRRAARDRNMAAPIGSQADRRRFDELFEFFGAFRCVHFDRDCLRGAQKDLPRMSEDTETYIARTPSLSPLSIYLLRENAAFRGPLYPLFREYLWGQVCGVPMRQPFTHLDELLNAIAQLQWRKRLARVCIGLNDANLQDMAMLTRSEFDQRRNALMHARFFACVREFRIQCLRFIDTLDQLEGAPRRNAATFLLRRDAFLAGRERPRERRWALAALGIGRADEAPPYISDVDLYMHVELSREVSDA
jgi:hypothetical protein